MLQNEQPGKYVLAIDLGTGGPKVGLVDQSGKVVCSATASVQTLFLSGNRNLRRYMFFAQEDWAGGVYGSPTVQDSRSAGLSAALWAAMVCMGEEGYLKAARAIMDTADKIREGVAGIPELRIMGKSTFLISLTSDALDPYFVNDYLAMKGWRMNDCQNPPGLHFCITLPQTQPGIAEQFVRDLVEAVEFAKHPPYEMPKTGFLYGLGVTSDGRAILREGLKGYMDASYEYE